MKVRIRFEKTGPIRFVGHLDFMRTIQKSIRRSPLPAVYTKGFSPHMLVSFADPLGVGEETTGDYMDLELALKDPFPLDDKEAYRLSDLDLDNEKLPDCPSSDRMLKLLNDVMPEGVRFTDIVRIGLTRSSKAMALVRYADYDLYPEDSFLAGEELPQMVRELLEREEVLSVRETRKGVKEENIRPHIKELGCEDGIRLPAFLLREQETGRRIRLTCDTGSVQNLKPAVCMEALAAMAGREADPFGYRLVRREIYDEEGRTLLSLGQRF